MRTAYISVNVANVWTKPNLPRKIDTSATSNPVDMTKWLSMMSDEDKIWLIDQDILQTQVLYGGQVLVLEEKAGWSHVLVTDQVTPKHDQGYPGWIPTVQLAYDIQFNDLYDRASSVWVTVPKTDLTYENSQLPLSYLTRLPFLRQEQERVVVGLPTGGEGWLQAAHVTIRNNSHHAEASYIQARYPLLEKRGGEDIIKAANQFLGLPYLWSGMSSFGYDCSGFVHAAHKANGILIPRDASAQFQYGLKQGKNVDKTQLSPGDLVYFKNEKEKIYHVGLYVGEGNFLHASNTNKVVMVQPLFEGTYGDHYCGAMRFY